MSTKTPLHPDVKAATPSAAKNSQILLRWCAALAGAIVAVMVGRAVDLRQGADGWAGPGLPGWWWALTLSMVALAALSSAVATSEALRTQWNTEEKLQELAQRSWLKLGPLRLRGQAGELLDLATNGAMRAALYRGGFLAATVASLSAPVVVWLVIGVEAGWKIAAVLGAVVIIGPLLVGGFQGMNKDTGSRFRASQMHLRGAFLEGIRALESLAYAGAGGRYAEELAETNERHRRKIMRLLLSNQVLILIMDLVFSLVALVLATILAVGGVRGGTLSVGQALSLLLLTLMLVAPVDMIGQFFYIGIGGRAAQRQYSQLLRDADEASEGAGVPVPAPTALSDSGLAVQVSGLTAGWPDGPDLLHDVNVSLREGERVALVGPSGSGKSTFSAVLQGTLAPRAGSVQIIGDIAVVEQRSYLFNQSIADNLRLARADATDEQLWDALAQANLAEEVAAMPDGLNTELGDHGSRLSGGQAGRLAIARALLRDAPILILDEPTSQVDLASEALILDALETAAVGRTVLTVAHRRAAVRQADRVLQVEGGTIVSAQATVGEDRP